MSRFAFRAYGQTPAPPVETTVFALFYLSCSSVKKQVTVCEDPRLLAVCRLVCLFFQQHLAVLIAETL